LKLKAQSMQAAKNELITLRGTSLTSLESQQVENLLDAIDAYEDIVSDIKTLVCKEVAENIIDELKELHLLFSEFDILAEIITTTGRSVSQKMDHLRNCNDEVEKRIRVLEQHPPSCTKCNNNLIIREGKGTYFWGCPDFPKCWGKRFLTKEEQAWIYDGVKPEGPKDSEDETESDSTIDVVMKLSQGIDPVTGEVLPEDSFMNNPKVIRALFKAVSALEFFNNYENINNDPDDEDLSLNQEEEELYEALREWRRETSKEKMISAFIVVENKPLKRVAKIKPTSLEELKDIKGFGDYRVKEYGNSIIDVINFFTKI